MDTTELCYLAAADAIAEFKAKTLSPVELMQAVIDRAELVQGKVNAFTYTYYDEAMEQAKAAEARYAKGAPMGPLDGLPVGIKDENDIAGKPTSSGSLIMKDYVATRTSVNNERIMAAGGIVHARTATPEFSCIPVTWSRLWGVTRNPWNLEYTPGGSSGGAAASLAAGTSALCTGSDIGGSIRVPASTCGLVGYKPPYGRNSDDPPFNLNFFCHTGPLARTVKDTIRLQNVMSGPTPRDITTLRPKLVLPTEYEPIKGWKIAYSPDLCMFELDPEVRKNTEAALDVFRDLGAVVEEVDLGWKPSALKALIGYLNHQFGAFLGSIVAEHGDDMTTYCRDMCEQGLKASLQDYAGIMEVIGELYDSFGPMMEDYNLFVCPTMTVPSVAADFDPTRDRAEYGGMGNSPALSWGMMTTPFNALSRCPVLAVPSGRALNGVPTGIQLVGRTYCDEDVFQAAIAYEAALGGWFGDQAGRPVI